MLNLITNYAFIFSAYFVKEYIFLYKYICDIIIIKIEGNLKATEISSNICLNASHRFSF